VGGLRLLFVGCATEGVNCKATSELRRLLLLLLMRYAFKLGFCTVCVDDLLSRRQGFVDCSSISPLPLLGPPLVPNSGLCPR